jgi:hypothetical protein
VGAQKAVAWWFFSLDPAVGHARVGCDAVRWQGCSRAFGRHAVRLRNDPRLQARVRPARGTTLRARAREEEERRQRAASRLNRVCSVLTEAVKVVVGRNMSIHAVLPADESGQLPDLGSVFLELCWSLLVLTPGNRPWF